MNLELSPHQIDELRLRAIIKEKVINGEGKQQVSPLVGGCRSVYKRRNKTKELRDTNFVDNH